jgi:hypothetical protein
MKKILVAIAVLFVAGYVMAEGGNMALSTSSQKFLPARGIGAATQWTNGIALAQGQIVENNGYFYMAEILIASSVNEPVHMSGVANNLRFFNHNARKAVMFQNTDTAISVWFNLDKAAVSGEGIKLEPLQTITFMGFQSAFFAIAESGTPTISYIDINR